MATLAWFGPEPMFRADARGGDALDWMGLSNHWIVKDGIPAPRVLTILGALSVAPRLSVNLRAPDRHADPFERRWWRAGSSPPRRSPR